MVLIITIADTVHRKGGTHSIGSIATHVRSTLFGTVVLSKMSTELPWRPEDKVWCRCLQCLAQGTPLPGNRQTASHRRWSTSRTRSHFTPRYQHSGSENYFSLVTLKCTPHNTIPSRVSRFFCILLVSAEKQHNSSRHVDFPASFHDVAKWGHGTMAH